MSDDFGDFDEYDDIDELDEVQPAGAAPDASGGTGDGPADEEQVKPLYPDLYTFVAEFLGKTISRKLNEASAAGIRWDPDWWRYPEVSVRMELLWRTFEAARADKDPNKLESWFRLQFDHHFSVITSPTGPMTQAGGPINTIHATYPPNHPNAAAASPTSTQAEPSSDTTTEGETTT